MFEVKLEISHLIFILVGLIVWFTRLESKTSRNTDDIKDFKKEIKSINDKHDSLESELLKDLSDVKQALARIEGQLLNK